MSQSHPIEAIFAGKVAEKFGMRTAMDKQEIAGDVYLSETGLEGDECAETKFHGGVERALHQYPSEHYQHWQSKYRSDSDWLAPGMGENISTKGMLEHQVCIGDRYQWGEAIIEVSQPRSPCAKLNQRWGVEGLSVDMQDISRCGWLYRVIKPGVVNSTLPLVLVERPDNAMSIKQVCDIYFADPLNPKGLQTLLAQDKLSANWRATVEKRLATGEVENWNFRLLGHA
ncbi:MOSC domain-containing protein [Vibrio sp. LaRot3]|uniref:MOSC domain-containing protein n=1 Tax=Vibrio sp. LaRot3 TaxID=2998829 RepID=UPI0022CDD197|nr:MOSC domain-containing protein [Vibrio sp. LaRot3]MDA0148975.1 MOSC domain-containing protein [Vibrio sp. LaRot3]